MTAGRHKAGAAWGAVALLALWAAQPARAQKPASGAARTTVILSSPASTADAAAAADIVREIDDPNTGGHWLLERDPEHPGGPGRLVLEAGAPAARGPASKPASEAASASVSRLPVIRGGDRVIVEEHTDVVDARLEGVALGAAQAGRAFEVRLKIGGGVVRAVALGKDRAELAPEDEGRP